MLFLWTLKLYWLWIILGVLILAGSVLPPGISIIWAVVGGALALIGLVSRKAMRSDSFRSRIERNL